MRTQKILIPYKGREKYRTETGETTGGIIYASGTGSASGGGTTSVSFSPTITPASPDSYKIGSITIDGTTTNIYGQNTAAAGVPEWYNISMRHYTKNNLARTMQAGSIATVVENYNDNLKDSTQYRLVLLKWGRPRGVGTKWMIPMFSPRWQDVNAPSGNANIKFPKTECDIAWADTWWPIKSAETMTFNSTGHSYLQALFPKWTGDTLNETYSPFRSRNINTTMIWKNNHNRKYRWGVCLMKKTGAGRYGWQMVSNIAPVTLFITKILPDTNVSKSIQIETNKF